MQDVKCPYCGKWQKIDHDDGQGYEEEVVHQQECADCFNMFVFTTSIIYSYDAAKADCLNGGKHDWQLTTTCPKKYSKMHCTMCDDERKPTPEERVTYKLDIE